MAYDPWRKKVMLLDSGAHVWEYDASSQKWNVQSPTGGPPTVQGLAAMAYDAHNKRMVISGGDAGSGNASTDVWTYTDRPVQDYDAVQEFLFNVDDLPTNISPSTLAATYHSDQPVYVWSWNDDAWHDLASTDISTDTGFYAWSGKVWLMTKSAVDTSGSGTTSVGTNYVQLKIGYMLP
jgi:hypothetical protein